MVNCSEKESRAAHRRQRWQELVAVDRFTPVAHRIVLAVGAPATRAVPASLPFLSKQSLLRAVESLTVQGYRAFVCPIAKTG